jgi:hypothetical protein
MWFMFRFGIAAGAHDVAMLNGAADGIFVWPDSAVMNMRGAALVKMWTWAAPCVFILAVLGRLRLRENLAVRLLAQSAVLTFAGYLFVRFDQGHGWGFRYFHSAWGAVPILAGMAMTAGPKQSSPQRGSRLEAFVGAATILSLSFIVPFQLSQIRQVISQHLAQLESPQRPGNNIYFIHPQGGFYVADMVQFDPRLRNQDLLLVSHGVILDTELIRLNWPAAVKLAGTPAADLWYLGPEDQRVPIANLPGQRQWVISRVPSLPSAAGR